jgi:hypothetical protein
MTTMACLSIVDAPMAAACWRAAADGSNVKLPFASIVPVPLVLVIAYERVSFSLSRTKTRPVTVYVTGTVLRGVIDAKTAVIAVAPN